MVKMMAVRGHKISLRDAFKVARLGELAGQEMARETFAADRKERVRKGMVANHCADMRACGAWDGE